MPQRTFTNKDLNKPLKGSSRTYTNTDLDIEDDFQPDDFTPDSVEDDFVPDDEEQLSTTESPKEPSLWEQMNTPLWDAPSRFASDVADSIDRPQLNRSPGRARFEGFVGGALEGVGDLISGATSPLALATAAVAPMAKPITRGMGHITSGIGKILQKYPLTDWVPGSRFIVPPAIRRLDRNVISGGTGRGIESVGQKMKGVGKKQKPLEGEIVTDDLPTIQDGEIITPKMKELPPSKVFHYGDEGLIEGESITPIKSTKVIRTETPPKTKPKMRTNGDGTFTNLDTGEIVNSKGQPIIEINGELTRDSPFFKRNRQ